jgi:histidinol dehydrogenase
MSNRKNGLVMQQFNYPLPSEWEAITQRPTASYDELEGLVSEVFKKVEAQGDRALLEIYGSV